MVPGKPVAARGLLNGELRARQVRDGAKRKVFQVPPPNAGQDRRSGEGLFGEDGVGVDVKEDLAELGTV